MQGLLKPDWACLFGTVGTWTADSRLWQEVQHMPNHRTNCAAEDEALLAEELNHSFAQFEVK